MMQIAVEVPGFVDYMPDDHLKDTSKIGHDFFWGILNTLNPDLVTAIIDDIEQQKVAAHKPKQATEKIEVHPDILASLLSKPLKQGKSKVLFILTLLILDKGRMNPAMWSQIKIVKRNHVPQVDHPPRINVSDFLKRQKLDPPAPKQPSQAQAQISSLQRIIQQREQEKAKLERELKATKNMLGKSKLHRSQVAFQHKLHHQEEEKFPEKFQGKNLNTVSEEAENAYRYYANLPNLGPKMS